MSTSIIIIICLLLILAYIFDITSSKTKIPSVILLLLVGWAVKQGTDALELSMPNLTSILPILGTVGLILIVLEGSLELELNRSKMPFVGKTALVAMIPMLLFSFGLAYALYYFGGVSFKVGLTNAIPIAVISSSIAIPSAQNLATKDKEFITYESSLSDIFGVILFNFVSMNDEIGTESIGHFMLEMVVILILTFIATLGLSFLLSKIKHPVKFIPIILIIVMLYNLTKIYHLPGLIFILLFGIFLGNLDELRANKYIQKLKPDILNKEVHKFKELTAEFAFLVRALFFLLFGYLIETKELLNTESIVWALLICTGIFSLRYISLKIFKINISPILFIAPRGLITILLFLSIPLNQTTALVNNSLIIQVIILSALIMMVGLMTNNSKKEIKTEDEA